MAATVVVTGVGVIAGVDPLAAVIIGAGITAAIVSVRRQERKSLVRSSIGAFAVITLVGLLAASAIDANRSRPTALVIGRQEALRTRVGGHTVSNARDMLQPPPGTLTALGFAA
ncbi:MAG: hypothetical protein JST64_08090, partial [Actinobacteria bacterium]|nr:hypothetical protein [Actinomycetota bacterium]